MYPQHMVVCSHEAHVTTGYTQHLALWQHLFASTVCKGVAASNSCVTKRVRTYKGKGKLTSTARMKVRCPRVLCHLMHVCAHSGKLVSRMCVSSSQTCPCLFEYIYLSRPDSVLNDMSVYNFQLGLGSRLSERIRSAPYTSSSPYSCILAFRSARVLYIAIVGLTHPLCHVSCACASGLHPATIDELTHTPCDAW